MSIKTSKRIALGVIASLVFAPFAAIAPASAGATNFTSVTINNNVASVVAGDLIKIPFTITTVGTLPGTASGDDVIHITPTSVTKPSIAGTLTAATNILHGGTVSTTADQFYLQGPGASNLSAPTAITGYPATIDTDLELTPGASAAALTNTVAGTLNLKLAVPGKYTFAITPAMEAGTGGTMTAGTITVFVLPSASNTTSLTATANLASYQAQDTSDAVVTISRNTGASANHLDGLILARVSATSASASTGTVGTVIGGAGYAADASGVNITVANSSGNTDFTFDLGATGSATKIGAGTYEYVFWNDTNSNEIQDSGEPSVTYTLNVSGDADSLSVTISDTVLSSDANFNTFTVVATVSDEDGLAASGSVLISETTSAGSTSADENLTSIPDGQALARIGTTNQYTGTFTVDTAVTSADSILTYVTVHIGSIDEDSDLTSINAIRVVKKGELVSTAGSSTMSIEDKVGIGKYTSGVRDALTGDASTDITVTVDKTVTSHKYTFNAASGDEGEYLLIAVAPAGTTASSVVAPVYTHVQIGAQLTATYTVTATSPAAADSYTITVTDGSGDNTVATVTFATAAPGWTTSPSSNFKAKFGDKLSITGTLADQFGRVLDGKAVYVDVAATGRNGGRVNGTTDSAGKYTFTWTDASASTTVLTDSITFKYDYLVTATSTTASTASSTALTVTYSATGVEVGSVFVSAPSATQTRAIDQKAAVGLPRASARVTYTATVYDADGDTVGSGVLVTFAGGADDLFYAGSTGVTASDGTASVVVYRTMAGSASITATANGVTSAASAAVKWTNDVENGDDTTTTPNSSTADYYARYISLSADPSSSAPEGIIRFVAKVTDRWGNPVAGVAVTFSETGVGRFMTGQTNPNDTNALGEVSIDLSTAKGETGTVSVSALITDANAVQKDDIAGYMTHTAEAGNTYTSTSTVVAGVTAAVKSATATATVAAPATPEVVVPPVAPTLTGSLNGRVLLFGACQVDEGDMIIYVKSPGKAWNEKAKTLECVAGEFDGSIRAPKNTKLYRVKQEGTGLWSSSVLIRP